MSETGGKNRKQKWPDNKASGELTKYNKASGELT